MDVTDFAEAYCSLIFKYQEDLLVSGDELSDADSLFIKDYFNSTFLTEDNWETIRDIIKKRHREYCKNWTSLEVTPYNFIDRFDCYMDKFREKWCCQSPNADFPNIIDLMFDLVSDLGAEFRSVKAYVNGYVKYSVDKTIEESQNTISKKFSSQVKDLNDKYNKSLEAIDDTVKTEKESISKKVSETSVTILGMFTGIVLTVVAGLFYSSSVLENINQASASKLILVSSLVGFVCINIIAVMFNYIDKFRNPTRNGNGDGIDLKVKWEDVLRRIPQKVVEHLAVVVVDIVLLIAMAFSGICYVVNPETPSENDIVKSPDTNISVDMNVYNHDQTQESDYVTEETTSEEEETSTSEETSYTETESIT